MRLAALLPIGLSLLIASCGDEKPKTTAPDLAPPAPVDDLRVISQDDGRVSVAWTATGDNGQDGRAAHYDLRYSRNPDIAAKWDSALVVTFGSVPQPNGAAESFSLPASVGTGLMFIALRVGDEALNWSTVSNVVTANPRPDRPPNKVTDLRLSEVSETTVALEWTAPGSDGSDGTATSYDLRFSLSEITEENWATATPATGVPRPQSGGSAELFTVTGLERVQIFFFGIRAQDSVGNLSPLSNTVTATTLTARRLTNSARTIGALGPDWSPDGKKIVFQADWDKSGQDQLYVIDPNGGPVEQYTDAPGTVAYYPRWSPDGRKIAFVYSRDYWKGIFEIATMDAVPFAVPSVVASHGLDYALTSPSWSPDGTKIAYVANSRSGPLRTSDLYIVPSQGGAPERVAGGWSISGIDWSPDGSKIVYASDQGGNMDIWTISVDGVNSEQLTDDVAQDAAPVWSPDGTSIVYASFRSGNYDLWVMASSGENRRQITRGPAQDGDESWSPDGSQIVYGSFANPIGDLWVVGVE